MFGKCVPCAVEEPKANCFWEQVGMLDRMNKGILLFGSEAIMV